jgi:hypothetical protein
MASPPDPGSFASPPLENTEFGTGNREGEMADDRCRMADDRCEVRSGGCGDGESGEPTPEVSQGRIVGHDSNRVIEDSTNDKIGILPHEGTDAADRPCQSDCVRHSLPCGVKTPQKAPNEAKPESTQGSLSLKVKSSATGPAGRERTRSREAVASGEWRENRGQWSVTSEVEDRQSSNRMEGRGTSSNVVHF